MCGRFVQAHSAEEYGHHFSAALVLDEPAAASWNVAPTDPVLAVAVHEGQRSLGRFRWGLIPWYADSPKVAARHINARSETVATKAAFKHSFARRRCIIPADGFYEWERVEGKGKLPHYIHSPDGEPLALAGLWASWKDADGNRVNTCSIITTTPNDLVRPIHDRMPAILASEHWERWLDPEYEEIGSLTAMLGPAPSRSLHEHPVSTMVNDVKNDFAELVKPLE